MITHIKRIGISGGAGQIAYSLLFRLAYGDLFGPQQPIALHILETPEGLSFLKGVVMELEDCAFPLLKEIIIGSQAEEVFQNVDTVFLIGAKPRGVGMERKDLLGENGKIFVDQGKALKKVAAPHALILVVGNPCNTNSLVAYSHAKNLRFFGMTMLDQNRASALLAHRAQVPLTVVTHMTIWGNHSSTQVPDFFNARIYGKPVIDVIKDRQWLEKDFTQQVQNRGAEVIKARGKSSAASAAHAALESMRAVIYPTPPGEWFSISIYSDVNPYGVSSGLFFSFPCCCKGNGDVEIVRDIPIDSYLKQAIQKTEKELLEEKALIKQLLVE